MTDAQKIALQADDLLEQAETAAHAGQVIRATRLLEKSLIIRAIAREMETNNHE